MLYVRRKTMAKIPKWRGWTFATKLVLAARLVEWIAPIVKQAGKTLWIVVDGGYVKAPFLKRALRAGVTVIGRLRKDAALRDLPRKLRRGQRRGRGRPPKYGKNKISLAKRAAHRNGWETAKCTVYGKTVTKLYKTFLATYRPVGGLIRVVIVEEDHDWYPFFSTDPNRPAPESNGQTDESSEPIYTPLVTLWIFLGQVVDPDHSCRQAVARLLVWLTLQGRPACSAETGAYCKARFRLSEEHLHGLVGATPEVIRKHYEKLEAMTIAKRAVEKRLLANHQSPAFVAPVGARLQKGLTAESA